MLQLHACKPAGTKAHKHQQLAYTMTARRHCMPVSHAAEQGQQTPSQMHALTCYRPQPPAAARGLPVKWPFTARLPMLPRAPCGAAKLGGAMQDSRAGPWTRPQTASGQISNLTSRSEPGMVEYARLVRCNQAPACLVRCNQALHCPCWAAWTQPSRIPWCGRCQSRLAAAWGPTGPSTPQAAPRDCSAKSGLPSWALLPSWGLLLGWALSSGEAGEAARAFSRSRQSPASGCSRARVSGPNVPLMCLV